jgi:hypothetical protein
MMNWRRVVIRLVKRWGVPSDLALTPINSAVNSVTAPVKDGLRGMGFGDSTVFTIGNR